MKNLKKVLLLLGLVTTGIVLASCSNDSQDSSKTKGKTITITNKFSVDADEESGTSAFSVNEKVKVPVNPKKVVVYDLGALDTIAALGKADSVVAAPKNFIKGMTKERQKQYQSVKDSGSFFEPDFEEVAKLQPDVIFIGKRSASQKNIKQLKKAAPKAAIVYISVTSDGFKDGGSYLANTKDRIKTLGQIYNAKDKADSYITKIDKATKKLQKTVTKLNHPTMLFAMVTNGSLTAQSSTESRYAWLFSEIGFKSADIDNDSTNAHGESVSYEYIAQKDPDYIFLLDRGLAIGQKGSSSSILNNSVMKTTTAVKDNHVLLVSPSAWYVHNGGAQVTLDMLSEMQTFLDKNA